MLATKYSIFEKNGYKAVAITWAKDNKVFLLIYSRL
jgi:uncharacterized protein YkuJ